MSTDTAWPDTYYPTMLPSVWYVNATDLEEMFKQEFPCDTCKNPAILRSLGHEPVDCGQAGTAGSGGHRHKPPFHKCLSCYSRWLIRTSSILQANGCIQCAACGRRFTTIESYSNYREF